MDITLPTKPEKPLDTDCCGNGCIPCVLDIYESELKIWERDCLRIQSKKHGGCEQDEGPLLSEDVYRKFKIISVQEDCKDVFVFRFEVPNFQSLGFGLGQHVIIRCYDNDGLPITRQYSPVSPVGAEGYFELLVKQYPNGKMSSLIRDWEVGTLVEFRGPFNGIQYKRNLCEKLYLVAMGTGIAPFVPIISAILSDEKDEVIVKLIFGCKNIKSILLRRQVEEWRRFWNFSVVYCLSDEAPGSNLYGCAVHHGKITSELLSNELRTDSKVQVLVCGSSLFAKDMLNCLENLHIPESAIVKL